MTSYNVISENKELKQKICNLISYILWLYDKHLISERTKEELLKRCDLNV